MKENSKKPEFLFSATNYKILIIGLVVIALGFILMSGGANEDPNVFNPAIFDTQRITIAPMVCLLGFVTIIVAIMWRPKTKNEEA